MQVPAKYIESILKNIFCLLTSELAELKTLCKSSYFNLNLKKQVLLFDKPVNKSLRKFCLKRNENEKKYKYITERSWTKI